MLEAAAAAADGKCSEVQSLAAIFISARLQTAGAEIASPAARSIAANALPAAVLGLLAADSPQKGSEAKAAVERVLTALARALADAPDALGSDVANAARAFCEAIAAAQTDSFSLLDGVTFDADQHADIRQADFGFQVRAEGEAPTSDAAERLERFGSVITLERSAAAAAVRHLSERVADAHAAIAAGDLAAACEALQDVRSTNAQAAKTLQAPMREAALEATKSEAAAALGLEPNAVDFSPRNDQGELDDGTRLGAQLAEQALDGQFCSQSAWNALPDLGSDRMTKLFDAAGQALSLVRTGGPEGEPDPALLERMHPRSGIAARALSEALLAMPQLADAEKARARSLLDQAPSATDEKAQAALADQALGILHGALGDALARLGATPAAQAELDAWGINAAHPLGSINGGLLALSACAALGSYQSPEGIRTFSRMAELAADGLDALTPPGSGAGGAPAASPLQAFAAELRAQGQAFETATSSEGREAAFAAVMRLFAAAGASGTNLPKVAELLGETAQTLAAKLADPSSGELGERLEACLRGRALGAENVALLGEFISGLLHCRGAGSDRARLDRLALAADMLMALSVNDFFCEVAGTTDQTAGARLRLSQADRAERPALARLLEAGGAFASAPSAERLLSFAAALRSADAAAVATDLKAEATKQADAASQGKTPEEAAEIQADFAARADALAAQLEALRGAMPALIYGAHALYAVENRLENPAAMSRKAPGNAGFVQMLEALPEPLSSKALGLMREGVRGSLGAHATRLAVASMRATGLHLSRADVYEAFGASTDVNLMRSMRYCLSRNHPDAPYDKSADLSEIARRFRSELSSMPFVRYLCDSRSDAAQAARAYEAAVLSERMRELGITPQAVAQITKGIDAAELVQTGMDDRAIQKKLAQMEGQTAGMQLMMLTQGLINTADDMDGGLVSKLLGRKPELGADGSWKLSEADLRTMLRNAAALPMHGREAAALFQSCINRSQANGVPCRTADILASLDPQAPEADALARMDDESAAAAMLAYEEQKSEAERIKARIQTLWNAQSDADSIRTLSNADAAALAAALSKPDVKTLGKAPGEGGRIEAAAQDLASALKQNAADITAKKRTLFSLLAADRIDRGRYVLMTKAHGTLSGSAAEEFNRAWEKAAGSGFPDLPALRQSLMRQLASSMAANARLVNSASGQMEAQSVNAAMTEAQDEDPKLRLALRTACHCALELSASALGQPLERLLPAHWAWQGEVDVDKLRLRGDQREAVEAMAAGRKRLPLHELVAANLSLFMPKAAADAYVAAMMAEGSKGARAMSLELFGRSRELRIAKYFRGLVNDIQASYAEGRSLLNERSERSARFHERQAALNAQCLECMTPGQSVAIDKSGRLQIIGVKLGREAGIEQDGASGSAGASITANVGVDLADAVVFTKNLDGTVTVSVAKRIGASAEAKATASAQAKASAEAGGEFKAELGLEASVGASAGGQYTLAVENRVSTAAGGALIDRIISRHVAGSDLRGAAVVQSGQIQATAAFGISASASLGFEAPSESEDKVELAAVENPDGSKTTITLENGKRTTETEEADGTKESLSVTRRVTTMSLPEDEEGMKVDITASAGAQGDGSVSAAVAKRSTPEQIETTYTFQGALTLRTQASVTLPIVGEADALKESAAVSFSVENAYTRVDSKLSGRTTSASKSTACAFVEDESVASRAAQLGRLLVAQKIPQAKAAAVQTLVAGLPLAPSRIVVESDIRPEKLEEGPLSSEALMNPANYTPAGLVIAFERSSEKPSLVQTALNQIGQALGGAFEFSTTISNALEIRLDLEGLDARTTAGIARILEQAQSPGIGAVL